MKHYHKFVSLEEGKKIYFGDEGKLHFERSARSKAFKYIGQVTEEERKSEEAEALQPRKPHSQIVKENADLVAKHKAEAVELTSEALSEVDEKATVIEDELEKDKAKLKTKKKKDEQEEA